MYDCLARALPYECQQFHISALVVEYIEERVHGCTIGHTMCHINLSLFIFTIITFSKSTILEHYTVVHYFAYWTSLQARSFGFRFFFFMCVLMPAAFLCRFFFKTGL